MWRGQGHRSIGGRSAFRRLLDGLRADDFALAMEAPDVFLAMQQRKQRTKQKVVINARVAPPVGRHSFDSPGGGWGNLV